MKVRELMTRSPVTIQDGDDVALGLQIMAWGRLRHLPVLHEDRLVGVVSERDLLANRQENRQVSEVMTAPVQVADPEDEIAEAARRMVGARLGCLPVVARGKLLGIVTVTDLVAAHGMPGAADDLRIPVSVAMTRSPISVSPEDFLLDAVRLISTRQVRHAPVVDADLHVIGMLSDRDIRLALGATLLFTGDGGAPPRVRLLKVREAMSSEPVVVQETSTLAEAAATFLQKNVGALPVVDRQERLVGILSYVDVLRALLERRGGTSVTAHAM